MPSPRRNSRHLPLAALVCLCTAACKPGSEDRSAAAAPAPDVAVARAEA
ncbi:hypothetical protein HPY25_15295, partial [Methylobacterium sp. IIF4SW-B5]|nr:hypothetical protein [Methylobacterium ajmalii]